MSAYTLELLLYLIDSIYFFVLVTLLSVQQMASKALAKCRKSETKYEL